MDFQTLNRRELQALCKLNKIPANVTNIAMVDALKSLETVEGIEEFLNPSGSETAGLSIESPERIEVTSPRVPRTSCRTSTRQKVQKSETESLHATVNRTTSRGVRRQLTGEVTESLKTPLVTSTRKKVTTTSTHEETLEKETTTVQRAYSTRRSTRLTAKKSEELDVIERERSEPVKLDSFLDEVKDVSKPIEEKHDVVVPDESDESSEIQKIVNVDLEDPKSDSEEKSVKIIEKLENDDLEDLKPDSEEKQMVVDEKIDLDEALNVSVKEHDDNQNTEDDDNDSYALSLNPSDPSVLKLESIPSVISEAKKEVSEDNSPLKLDNDNADEVMTSEDIKENISENKVDFGDVQESVMEEIDIDVITPVISEEGETDVSFIEEEKEFSMNTNESLRGMTDVSDNKENEEKINEKESGGDEKANKSLNDISLRQLKKQLKALTIKNSMEESCVTIGEMEN